MLLIRAWAPNVLEISKTCNFRKENTIENPDFALGLRAALN